MAQIWIFRIKMEVNLQSSNECVYTNNWSALFLNKKINVCHKHIFYNSHFGTQLRLKRKFSSDKYKGNLYVLRDYTLHWFNLMEKIQQIAEYF